MVHHQRTKTYLIFGNVSEKILPKVHEENLAHKRNQSMSDKICTIFAPNMTSANVFAADDVHIACKCGGV